MAIFNEHTNWMDVMKFASSRSKLEWTYIILGKAGPTGKTHLYNMLRRDGYNAIELSEDVADLVNYNDDKNHYKVDYDRKLLVIVLNKPLPGVISHGKNPAFFSTDDWLEVCRHETRAEAEDILNKMKLIAETYGDVTRADYMDLVDLHSTYTDNKYGWVGNTIEKARIVPGPLGWFIEFPRAVQIRFD